MSAINPTIIYPPLYDSRWGNIGVIDFCGYCVTSFGAGGGMDNLNFSVGGGGQVPLPAALPLFATGAGLLGLLGWRRKKRAVETAA